MGRKLHSKTRPRCNLSLDDPGWVAITENHHLLKTLMQRAGSAALVASILDDEAKSGRMPLLFQSKRGGPRQRVTREFLDDARIGTMHVDAPYRFGFDDQPRVLVLGLYPRWSADGIRAQSRAQARALGLAAPLFPDQPRDKSASRLTPEQSQQPRPRTISWAAMGRLVVFAPQSYLEWLFPMPFPQSDESPKKTRTRAPSGSNELTIKQIEDAIEFAAAAYNTDPKRWKHRTKLAEYVTTEHLKWPENKWQTIDRHITTPLFQEPALRRKINKK